MSFTVYKSSAGSGKTFTLVKEYLNLVLPEPSRFRNILAITFTNKAANEMKERIIISLKEIAALDENPETKAVKYILPDICNSSGLSPEILAVNAEKTLKNILHDYSDFAISTIDSFVHRVIRSFAFDLHLPLNFEVEMDEDELRGKVVDILISRVGTDEQLTRILVNFVQSRTEDEKSWNIDKDLMDVANYLSRENGQEHIEKLKELNLTDFFEINRQIIEIVRRFEKTVVDYANQAIEIIQSKGIPHESFYRGNQGISIYFENLTRRRFDKLKPNSYVIATIENDKWFSGKVNPQDKSEIDEIKPRLIEIYYQLSTYLDKQLSRYIFLQEIRKNIFPLAVLNEIAGILADYKKENEIVMISEFNKRIAEIVMNEPVPFIYERLGEKYRHFLVDEFQDTSILQWQNLLPLIENSLAESKFNMVVGDGKQAIYRWRGGEVEQFAGLPNIYRRKNDPVMVQREQSLVRNYHPVPLENNFRSKKEIVEFNNAFFTSIATLLPEQYKTIYSDVAQHSNPENKGGFVQFLLFQPGLNDCTFEAFNLEEITHTLSELLSEGFSYGDIAILCRNNLNAGFLAQELLKQNVPVISSESLQLGSSAEVRLVVAAMKAIYNASDNIARVEIINYLNQSGRLKGSLHEMLKTCGMIRSNADEGNSNSDFFDVLASNNLELFPTVLMKYSMYDLAEELIRVFELHRKPDPYIQFFLEAVLKFSKEQNKEIADFIEWWDKKGYKQSIIVPAGSDAVRVMTIHKAKGLEFPVVFYPFANEKHRNSADKLWVDVDDEEVPILKAALVNTSKTLLETPFAALYEEENGKSLLDLINLLYVVMTRPTDRLYVISSMPPKSSDPAVSVPVLLKHFLSEKGIWNETESLYKFGEKSVTPHKKEAIVQTFKLDNFISNPWRDRMMVSLQAHKNWDIDDKTQSLKWGNLIHFVLAQIITAEDVGTVIEKLEAEGIIKPEEKETILSVLNPFLSHPDVAQYFLPGLNIKAEPEILLPNGKTFRPDRIVLGDNQTTVIDFKTGKPEENQREQVRFYMKLMDEMGYQKIKGILLYIAEKDPVVEVY